MYTSWMGIGGDATMTYKQALEEARNGKWISRSGWENLFGWYHIRMDTNNYLIMVDPLNGVDHETREKKDYYRAWEYSPTDEDKKATDWEVIGEIRKWR